MKKIIPNGKQLDQSKTVGSLKIWKMPILIQLDIKQTLTTCKSGYHWEDPPGDCVRDV